MARVNDIESKSVDRLSASPRHNRFRHCAVLFTRPLHCFDRKPSLLLSDDIISISFIDIDSVSAIIYANMKLKLKFVRHANVSRRAGVGISYRHRQCTNDEPHTPLFAPFSMIDGSFSVSSACLFTRHKQFVRKLHIDSVVFDSHPNPK